MRRFSAIIVLGAALLAGPALADAPSGDALRTLDQFMVARSAVAKCGNIDATTTAAFRSNYRQVALQARAELKALLSDLSEALIEKVMSDHYDDIDRHLAIVVAQESCEGPRVLEALQRYGREAQMVTARLAANKAH